MRNSIEYDGETIPFEVRYSDRKTLEIAVHPDGTVRVKVPPGTTQEAIRARLQRRARWIRKKLEYFRLFEPRTPPKRYVGGETHLFLGRQYRLKLMKSSEEGAKLKGGYFYITSADPDDPTNVKALLDEWYTCHARILFQKRVALCYKSARGLQVLFPIVTVRRMKKRWGSCSKKGRIVLNIQLIKASLFCIDYVIMHELCHLKIPHHNENYYRLLRRYMPDWEKRKQRLESTAS